MGKPYTWIRYDGEQNEHGDPTPPAEHLTDGQAQTKASAGAGLAAAMAILAWAVAPPLGASLALLGLGATGGAMAVHAAKDKWQERNEALAEEQAAEAAKRRIEEHVRVKKQYLAEDARAREVRAGPVTLSQDRK